MGWKSSNCIVVFVSIAAAVLVSAGFAAEKRAVMDSAGRRVEVPGKIERVFAAGGPASVFTYTLAPEKLLGWTSPLTPEERAYIPAPYAGLPTLGRLTGRGNTANVESVLASRPDVIVDYGTINPTYISLAERVQKQTGVPYLLFDGGFSQIARVYVTANDPESWRVMRNDCLPMSTGGSQAYRRKSDLWCISLGDRAGCRLRSKARSMWRASNESARAMSRLSIWARAGS